MMTQQSKIEAGTLYGALVAAQAEMRAPTKDREVKVKMKSGGTYTFAYATMAAMVEAARPILTKHGLWFTQFIEGGSMVTRIIHASGHMDCPIPMPNLPSAPQEAGSIITYFKRYSFAAAFGQVAEEEDDGNIAQGNDYAPVQEPRADMPALITGEQRDLIQTLAPGAGKTTQGICEAYRVAALTQLTQAQAAKLIERLRADAKEPVDA